MQFTTLLTLLTLTAAAPVPEPGWQKNALIAGGVGVAALGTYEIVHHVSKHRKEKKLKEAQDKMMKDALAASTTAPTAPAADSTTQADVVASINGPENFKSLKETPPFPQDKNPMAGLQ